MKKKMLFKGFILGLTSVMTLGLTGCADTSSETSSSASSSSSTSQSNSYETDAVITDQMAMPQPGEQIAVFNVEGYGTFQARLFPEAAPKAVENFVELASEGAYNGVPFHRGGEDFMIQSGDTTLNGGDGQSIYGSGFGVELNESLHHYTGALAVARTSSKSSGQSTQFYIVSNQSTKDYTDADWNALEKQTGVAFDEATRAAYQQYGGAPSLDMNYTVFGQVFAGQEVVDAIAAASVELNPQTGENSAPNPEIILSSVEITTYQG